MRLIDADALYYKVKCECNPYGKPTIDFESGKKVLDWIEKAPTVEERPHGEWISRRDKQGTHIYSVCSKCNVAYLDTDFPNFCPNCGSDNRETSPTKDLMRRGEQLREWILQGMKEGD